MMNLDITQDNLYLLLPSKVSLMAKMLCDDTGISIVEATKRAGIYDETVFVLTSDHGGKDKGHGGKTLLEMESPFIICGKGIRRGHEIMEPMMQYDVAATVAYVLGLEQPQVWTGRPMLSAFGKKGKK